MEQIKKIWPTIKAYLITALGGATAGVPQAEYDALETKAEQNAAAVAIAVQATADAQAQLAAAQKENADLRADMLEIYKLCEGEAG